MAELEKLSKTPRGELAIRTLAMPAYTNPNGDIFGGWVVSQMDLAGASTAQKIARGRVATVAIDKMVFISPIQVGNLVCCYADLIKVGRTSMTINIQTWALDQAGRHHQVTEGIFTFVAIDEVGRPRPVASR